MIDDVIELINPKLVSMLALALSGVSILVAVILNRKNREYTDIKTKVTSRDGRIHKVVDKYRELVSGHPPKESPGGQALILAGIAILENEQECLESRTLILNYGLKDPLSDQYRDQILSEGMYKFFQRAKSLKGSGEQFGRALKGEGTTT